MQNCVVGLIAQGDVVMSDYGKAEFVAIFSEDSKYQDPEWQTNWDAYEVTPDESYTKKVEAATGGTTITVSQYAAMTLFAIKNTDPITGNKVTATWTDNDANANTQKIPPGGLLVIPDLNPTAANVVLTAANAAVICKVAMFGS
jgi:hypothetical protein